MNANAKSVSNSEKCVTNESSRSFEDEDANPANVEFSKLGESEIIAVQFDTPKYRALMIATAFLCGFGYSLDHTLRSTYTGYATNSYAEHSLLSTIQVINAVVSVGSQVVFSRLSDYFGRVELFVAATILYVIGTIVQSQAYSVSIYAAGAVFYNSGNVGVTLVLLLILSDFSSLKWRILYQYVPYWPFIIIPWISGNIVTAANPEKDWSWDIAMWAFIFPLSALPMICLLVYMMYKSSKTPEWKALKERTHIKKNQGFLKNTVFLFWELDSIGIILITVSLGCVLVPLTLANGVSQKWHSSKIIGTLVFGGVLFCIFVFWETAYAKNPLLPFKLLGDRGIWAPLGVAFFNYFTFFIACDFLYPVLLVSMNESSTTATRILNLPDFVGATLSPFYGILVAKARRLKFSVVGGCAAWMISMGLFYQYRGGSESHGGAIAASVIMGMSGLLCSNSVIVSLQAMTTHGRMAVITSIYFTFSKVGAAVGASVSGAVWTQIMPNQLRKAFSNDTLADAAYESPYTFIYEYPWGSPERIAVVEAYRYVQRIMMTIGLVCTIPFFAFTLFMRDPELIDKSTHEEFTEDGLALSKDEPGILPQLKVFFRGNRANRKEKC